MIVSITRLGAVLLTGVLLAPQVAFARMNYRRLLKDLPDAEAVERPLITRAIGRSHRKRAMRALLIRFGDQALPIPERASLATALGDLGYEDALPALVSQWSGMLNRRFQARSLPPEEEAFRASVVTAIGKTAEPKDQEALGVLRRAALDEDKGVALAALEGLGRLRDLKSFETIARLVRGDDADLSRAATRALAGLGDDKSEQLLRVRLESTVGRERIEAALSLGLMRRKIGALTLDGFLEEVDGPYEDGITAAAALAELGHTSGLAYLSEILKPPVGELRDVAIDALGASRAPRAILPLASVLDDCDASTRLRVIRALERIGGDRAAFELRRRRKDGEPQAQDLIRRSRARLGDYVLP